MALELIKINEFPQVAEPGEWIVVSGSDGVAYKISKEDFKEWLGTVTVITDKPIALADPAPTVDGVYLPTESGTYTNAGGLEYDPNGVDSGKYVQFIKNDTAWTKLAVDLPQAENKILDWDPEEPDSYLQGDQVTHNGQIWSVVVPSTTEEPGTGTDWVTVISVLNTLESTSTTQPLSANQGRVLDEKIDNTKRDILHPDLSINYVPEINKGTISPTSFERLAADNAGIDGIEFSFIDNDGSFPIAPDLVSKAIRHVARRPTSDQYSRSTFTFGRLEVDEKEIEGSIQYAILVKRSTLEALPFQVQFYIELSQLSPSGTLVTSTFSTNNNNLLVEGFELETVSNSVNCTFKVVEVRDEWIAVCVRHEKKHPNEVAAVTLKTGLAGLTVASVDRIIIYFNPVLVFNKDEYAIAFNYFPETLADVYPEGILKYIKGQIPPSVELASEFDTEDETKAVSAKLVSEYVNNLSGNSKVTKFIGNSFPERKQFYSIFENDWTGGTIDNVNYLTGDSSLMLESSDTALATLEQTGLELDMTNKVIHLRCWIENYETLRDIEIRFCVDGDWNKRFVKTYSRSSGNTVQYLQNGWNDFTFPLGIAMTGVEKSDMSRIDSIRIAVRSMGSSPTRVSFDEMAFYENPMSESIISITFDDGYKSLVTHALPYMSRYNMRGLTYVITNAPEGGNPYFCNVEDLKKLDRAGWDIANHTHNHLELPTVTLEEVEEQFQLSLEWFAEKGFKRAVTHLSYPRGMSTPDIREIVPKYFTTGRISSGGGSMPRGRYNSFPLMDSTRINVVGIDGSTSMADVQTAIDDAVNNRIWLVFMMHGIQPSEGVTMPIEKFYAVIDAIRDSGVRVATFSELTDNNIPSVYLGSNI